MAKKKLFNLRIFTKRSFWKNLATALAPHDEIMRRTARERDETTPSDAHSKELDTRGKPCLKYNRPVRHLGSV